MFKAKCPNCNQIVDVKLGHCTNCNYDISKFMEDHGYYDGNQLKIGYVRICPKCGLITSNNEEIFYCRNCNAILKQTDVKVEDFDKIIWEKYNYNIPQIERDYINKYVKDTLDFTLYSKRIEKRENKHQEIEQSIQEHNEKIKKQNTNQCKPTCPTCGSTNIEKIHTASKILGAVSLGLLSKTAKSQFVCHNCGYKW